MSLYDNMRDACKRHGTSITTVLANTGHSTGITGGWKNGSPPKFDIFEDVANYLGVSLDELAYGQDYVNAQRDVWITQHSATALTDEELEWVHLLRQIPKDRRDAVMLSIRPLVEEPTKNDQGKTA